MLKNARADFLLEPGIAFLNHGSFGACPRPVLDAQAGWRSRMEAEPVRFLDRQLPGLLDDARTRVASFLNAEPDSLAFVTNATSAVNAVARSIDLGPGDEIVVSDHAYGAVLHTLERSAAAAGASVRVVEVPLPLPSDDAIVAGFVEALTDRTRLVLVDHIASITGAVFPVARIVESCRARGVLCMVDAAHAPGMAEVDLRSLAPDLWTGNFHKWACAPKGAAVISVSAELRERVGPAITSHGYLRTFHERFEWPGTFDPSAWLAVPDAIDYMASYGWDAVRAHNDGLAAEARAAVAGAIDAEQLVRDDGALSMTIVPLPDGSIRSVADARAASARMLERAGVEVPFMPWKGRSFVRISSQIYNDAEDHARLARALPGFLTA